MPPRRLKVVADGRSPERALSKQLLLLTGCSNSMYGTVSTVWYVWMYIWYGMYGCIYVWMDVYMVRYV